MALWLESGYVPQDLNPWKSPLKSMEICTAFRILEPGSELVAAMQITWHYVVIKKWFRNCQFVNEQDHLTKVSGNPNAINEYLLPNPLCIYLCTGEELDKNGHLEIKWLSQGHTKDPLPCFWYSNQLHMRALSPHVPSLFWDWYPQKLSSLEVLVSSFLWQM